MAFVNVECVKTNEPGIAVIQYVNILRTFKFVPSEPLMLMECNDGTSQHKNVTCLAENYVPTNFISLDTK
jgi:hypothetical protein